MINRAFRGVPRFAGGQTAVEHQHVGVSPSFRAWLRPERAARRPALQAQRAMSSARRTSPRPTRRRPSMISPKRLSPKRSARRVLPLRTELSVTTISASCWSAGFWRFSPSLSSAFLRRSFRRGEVLSRSCRLNFSAARTPSGLLANHAPAAGRQAAAARSAGAQGEARRDTVQAPACVRRHWRSPRAGSLVADASSVIEPGVENARPGVLHHHVAFGMQPRQKQPQIEQGGNGGQCHQRVEVEHAEARAGRDRRRSRRPAGWSRCRWWSPCRRPAPRSSSASGDAPATGRCAAPGRPAPAA